MMKLRVAGASPFARKVMVSAIETGQTSAIEPVAANLDAPDSAMLEENPLGRVPTLVLETGQAITGSSLICAYLDSLHQREKLIPESGPGRWSVLHGEALSDGLCESAIAIQREIARPAEIRLESWIGRNRAKVMRTARWLDRNREFPQQPVRIDMIALACALGWIEYRLGTELGGWRDEAPGIAAWYDRFSQRPSMRETAPG